MPSRSQLQFESLLLVSVTILSACSGFFNPAPDENVSRRTAYEYKRLPELPNELSAMARQLYAENASVEDIACSLLAACKLTAMEPDSFDGWYLASRSCGWLTDYGEEPVCYDNRRKRTVVVDCVELGEKAVEVAPENASAWYSLTVSLGMKLRHASIATASIYVSSLMNAARKSIELNSGLDEGGPLRILGALYQKAPAWPTGPGDLDEALELLEQAVTEHPNHPLNHLFYAEALLEDDEVEAALAHLDKAGALLDVKRYFWRTRRYEVMINKVRQRLDGP
jgi:tetratricopeptide (TPR) repeat protein